MTPITAVHPEMYALPATMVKESPTALQVYVVSAATVSLKSLHVTVHLTAPIEEPDEKCSA